MTVKYANAASGKTKQLIRDEFAKLLHEVGDIDKVSVTQLVERADISRSTFYAHYRSIAEVANDIKNETLQTFFAQVEVNSPDDVNHYFDEIYRYIKANDELFRLLLASTDAMAFVLDMGETYKRKLYELLVNEPQIKDKELLELEVHTLCDGFVVQFIRYYRGENDFTLEEIIDGAKLFYRNLHHWRCQR